MARRPTTTAQVAPLSPPPLAGEGSGERGRIATAPAPAGVRITVTGPPVFAVGRWFQPGVTALPEGYLRPRQIDELRVLAQSVPRLSVAGSAPAPNPAT